MVDTEQENTATGKSILKRRIRSEKAAVPKKPDVVTAERDAVNSCKRFVTFDETITIKNEKDLVVKKPLKLELVIENWKSPGGSGDAKSADDQANRPDSGIVKRLVDEFNAVQDPLTDTSEIDSALLEEDIVKEDEPTEIQTDIPLCDALETKAAEKLTNGKLTLLDRFQNRGRVNDLINMYNSKSTTSYKTEVPENKFIDF